MTQQSSKQKHNGQELPMKPDFGDSNSGNNFVYTSMLDIDDILNMSKDEFIAYKNNGNYKVTNGRNIN